VLGVEFAGTVAAAPPESPYKHGDRVFGSAQGAYGERVVAKSVDVLPLPHTLSFVQGAGASQKIARTRAIFSWINMHRAVHDVPDELRGASGARETSSWYTHAHHPPYLPFTC
jgi:hypothetical protein